MDHETYYSLSGDDLVALEPTTELPDHFRSLVSSKVEFFLDRPVLTIGSWDEPGRPHVLALDASGHLVSVISVDAEDRESLPHVVESIASWLDPLRLRDLSDLTNDPVTFYEGLWDLSPDASITLSGEYHIVCITAADHLDVTSLAQSVDHWNVAVSYLDVFTTVDGTPIIKHRNLVDTKRTNGAVAPTAADNVSVLTETPRIRPGATFQVDRLPLLFDPLGAELLSISDELFAVGQQLVLVDKLPDLPSESPFEDRNRFRWHGRPEQLDLLAQHLTDDRHRQRTIHLFVETDLQSDYCVYIGEITPIESDPGIRDQIDWFAIKPTLDIELFRLLRDGQLPQHLQNPTVDFGTLDA